VVAEVAVTVAAAAAVVAVATVAVAAAVLAWDDLLQGQMAVHCLVGPSSLVNLRGGQTWWCYPEDNTHIVMGSRTLVL
jgi:hypothetical protein